MKLFFRRLKKKGQAFTRWIWEQCKDVKTLILLGIVCLVLFSPSIVCYTLFFIFKWPWAGIVASAYWAFWLGPFSPFFVLAVTITLSIKRIMQVIVHGKKKDGEEEKENPNAAALEVDAPVQDDTDATAQDAPKEPAAENVEEPIANSAKAPDGEPKIELDEPVTESIVNNAADTNEPATEAPDGDETKN